MSLDFDWDFVTRKKKFRWPMVCPSPARGVVLLTLFSRSFTLQIDTFCSLRSLECKLSHLPHNELLLIGTVVRLP